CNPRSRQATALTEAGPHPFEGFTPAARRGVRGRPEREARQGPEHAEEDLLRQILGEVALPPDLLLNDDSQADQSGSPRRAATSERARAPRAQVGWAARLRGAGDAPSLHREGPLRAPDVDARGRPVHGYHRDTGSRRNSAGRAVCEGCGSPSDWLNIGRAGT